MKSCGARSGSDVVKRLLGTLWEMLRDALAMRTKCLGETFVRAFVGAMDRLFGSFVRWFVRSSFGSFARRKNYIRKPLRELAQHNSR